MLYSLFHYLPLPPDKRAGVLFGSAYGDALAAPTEFIRSAEQIRREFPPDGPTDLGTGRVTDDTQMMLAVGRALADATSANQLEEALRGEFVTWLHDPRNTRAPGMTCLQACRALEAGGAWQQASVHGSKGCGANMRVQPAAFLADEQVRSAVAQLQAAFTHGHPTALAASDLTAQTIALLLIGTTPEQLLPKLSSYIKAQREVYHTEWLGNLWEWGGDSPQQYMARGWDECAEVMHKLETALQEGVPPEADPCDLTGEGWIAEEAWATALLCFLLSPENACEVVRRAAVTKGDSDSLACLAGAFVGAYMGLSAFPATWRDQLEADYATELDDIEQRFLHLSERA